MTASTLPAVSVVVPTRDRREMLARALASVAAQTFADLEVVVVDDGSRAPCGDVVAAALGARLCGDRFRLVAHGTRRGAAAARNTGMTHARGELVAFLDDDDEWLAEKLARQVTALRAAGEDAALVYCGREIVSDRSGRVVARAAASEPAVGFADLLRRTVFPSSVPLLRRACVEAVGGFDETLAGTQDRDLWLRLARRWRFAVVDEVLVRCHVHGAQISSDLAAKVEAKERWVAKVAADLARHPQAHAHEMLRLGLLQAAAGRRAAARRSLLRALRLEPRSAAVRSHLVAALLAPERHRRRVLRESFRTIDGVPLYW